MMGLGRFSTLLFTLSCSVVFAQPVLMVTKSHSGNFTQGQLGTWTINVSNNGTVATSASMAVTVTDALPTGYTLNSSGGTHWNCSGSTTVICTNSKDTPGVGGSFPALTLTVSVPANSPATVQNSATASGGGAVSSATSNTDSVTVNQVPASIAATSGGGQSATINTTFAMPLVATVLDAANMPVQGATVTFTVVPNGGAGGAFAGGVHTATTDTSGHATSAAFTANGTAGSYSVTAAVGTVTGASFSLTNTVPTTPVLSVTKTHSGNFTQGQQGTWVISVSNTGTATTSGTVTVSDTLPAGYSFVSNTGTHWSCSGASNVTCTNSDVVPKGSSFAALSVTVSVPANSPTVVQNTAVASGGGASNPATSNSDSTTVNQVPATIVASSGGGQSATVNTSFASPLVAIVKDAAGAVVPNATVTFTVVPVAGAGGTFAGGSNTATTNSNGQAISAVFTANGTAGTYSVTAASGAASGATFSLTNTAAAAPVLSIVKSHSGSFTQGQIATWTINVSNTGTASTSGAVTVTDTLPTGYTLATYSGTNWSCTGAGTASVSCTDSVNIVSPNASFPALSLTVNVPASSPTSVQNSATASGGGATSPATSAPDTVTVSQVPATIVATSGGGQSAKINTAFAAPLVVTVKDAAGVAVPNATVTFTVVPAAGAGGSFAGGVNTATTGSNGQATSQTFTANGTAGSYSVTAASGAATGATFSLTNTTPAVPALSIAKSHTGNFTQGQTGSWTINISNTGTGSTSGTVTVTDTLPSGYTLASYSGAHWNCTGTGTASVSCTDSVDVVLANSPFPALSLGVNVPANSPVTVQNSATVSGGGAASSATSNTDTVTVTQVAATIAATGGTPQSASLNTAFASPLVAMVKDAAGVGVPNATVTFTVVPNNGAGGTFAGGVKTATTGPSGQASSATFTANGTVGSYTITAASGAATGATFSLTNTAGTPSKLAFTTPPPTNGTAGSSFSAVVQVQDSSGNLVNTSTAAVTLSSSPSGLASTTVNAVNGVATFNNLSINSANSYTLTAASNGLASASSSITINAAAASQVVFTTPPGNGTVGQALTPAVVAKIEDQFNNVVTSSSAQVTASSSPSGVAGTPQVNAVNGVATFTNLVFNSPNSYTLTAASAGLTSAVSGSFTISAGSPAKLTFTTPPPTNGTAGTAFTAVVQIQDSSGNLVNTSTAPVTITSSPSGLASTTVNAVNGVATFNSLTITATNTYTLTAASTGLASTFSSITINAANPHQVVFTTPPSNGTASQALTPAVVAKLEDQFGNVVSSNAQVSVSSSPSGVTGTLQVAAVNGVATFNNLVFNATNSYTLTAASAGLSSATSGSFTISPGSGSKLVFTMQPPASGTAGQSFSAVVTVEDSAGNVVTGSNSSVTITSSPTGVSGTATVTAVNGFAIFGNLLLNTAGAYTLTAAATGLTNATSTTITIGPGPASQMVFATPPGGSTAGQALSPAVVAKIEDAFGNVVASSNAQLTASSTPAGVSGTQQVNAVNGVATFSGLVFNVANNYTLTITSAGLPSLTSPSFTITSGSGSKLVFTTQPTSSATAGTPFSAVVQIQDSNGNLVSGSNAEVAIGSSPTGLSGTTTATAVNGIATFNNLVLNTTGGYTLSATSTGLTNATSTTINVNAAPASQVVFSTAPNSGTAGQALTPAVVAKIEDAFGNVVTNSSVQVTVASTPSGVSGTLQVSAANGVATFSNLVFNVANNYTLTASSSGLTSANSASFTISAGSGNKLVFNVQPSANGTAGQPLSPSITVQVQDATGNLVTNASANISISSTPTGIGGTLTAPASGGVATFDNLVFTATGNYTLTATSTGLSNATSTSIAIGPGAANKLAFSVQPSSGTAGQALSPAVAVQVQDANGNLVTSSSDVIAINATPPSGNGTATATAVAGVATFGSLSFNGAGNYTLNASSPGLTSANSTSFTISAGSGNKLAFVVQPPANATVGQALSPALTVEIQDAHGNRVTNSNAAVSIGSTPSGLGGTLTENASSGVATFDNVLFNASGSYTLTATSTGLSNATSTPVAIGAGPAAKLAFTVQPSSGTAAQALTPAVVLQIQDANGNLVTTSSASVTLSSAPAGIGGTSTANAVGGVVTFSNLLFSTAGNYTLTASSSGLSDASSNSFTISPGSGNKLVFTSQPPANGTAGQALSPPIVVQIQDAAGNLVTGSTAAVSISSTPVVTGGLGGTLSVNAVGGVATFSNIVFSASGNYNLTATSTGLANASSTALSIAPGAATKIAFAVQPTSGVAGQPLNPAVVVQIQDAYGNLVTSSNAGVAVSSTPSGVGGTQSLNAIGGAATFGNLQFAAAGNYTLTATSSGLTSVNSNPFTIAAGAPGGISVLSGGGQVAQVSRSFGNPLAVVVKDLSGNGVPNALVTFTAPASGPGGTFGGSTTTTAVTGSNGQAATSVALTANSIPGTFSVVASAPGVQNTAIFSLTNASALAIATSSLTGATQAAAYNQQLIATGGIPPYSWSVGSGSLPTGLSLISSGVLSGTPTVPGMFAFTARVRDSLGATADQSLALAVAGNLAISSCPASTGVVNQPYTSTATATGGQAPYTWSFTTGAFPPGLTLNALTGGLTGTPTSSGTFTVTLVVTDKNAATTSSGCGFTIAPALSISTATLSDASQSAPYSQTFVAVGGKGPYTWSVAAGAIPPGLSLSAGGTLSGTASQTGLFGFTIAVTDSTNATVQKQFTMNVFSGFVVGECPQPVAEVNFPYNSTLIGQGGVAPYTWSVSGSLPNGLVLNSAAGTVSGTPTVVGSASPTFTATDKGNRAVSKQCSISVQPAVAISNSSLAGGSTGASYTDGVTVSGGVSPYVYSTIAGSLPPGLAIDAASGKITGRPIASGSFSFTAQVTDNVGAQATKNLSITVTQGLTIPNCPAPVGSVGQPYTSPLVAQGGTTPYTWTISSGNLPPGLSLQVGDVVMIAGSPTQSGASAFVLQATDAANGSVTRACTIQISGAALTITTTTLPIGLLGVAYSQTLTAVGGTGPYVWTLVGSGAPPGFSIDSTGVLSGVPSALGTYTFTVQATDQSGNVAQQTITITVQAGTAPNVTITGLADIVDPATQPKFNIQLDSAYPAPIDGTVTLTVVPDPTIGVDDPAIQFAPTPACPSPCRTLKFTVAANSSTPVFTVPVALASTGTVAGTIQLNVKLSSSGSDITPPNTPVRSVRVDRLAPKIVSMTATQSSAGIQVTIVGYSTTREVTQGTFQFATSGGGTPLSATVQLSNSAKTWFGSTQSSAYGGQFTLTQPFTLQGSVGALTSVTVTLSNAQGTSSQATANF